MKTGQDLKVASLEKIEALFWDFDGVILDSNEIRDQGFGLVLKEFPHDQVERLIDFHQKNGGLSRYVKFRYFFEVIRGEPVTEEQVQGWADRFSEIMRSRLNKPELLIKPVLSYIEKNSKKLPMYIVSGSDQAELRYLCDKLKISTYFRRIHGSPVPKKDWVRRILDEENLSAKKCILIGDSGNDHDAAKFNGLMFQGFGNTEISKLSDIRLL